MNTKCPVCSGDAELIIVVYNIPLFGEALLTSVSCKECNYKSSDIIILREKKPKRYKLFVDSEKKLNARVIRSPYGNIHIPELGIDIKSTGFSEAFITNVEGLLIRLQDVIRERIMTHENKKKSESLLKRIDEARSGRMKFTLIIEDETGNSAIISQGSKV